MTQTLAHNIKTQLKFSIENDCKPMHGHFCQDHERPSVDEEKSLVRLCSSGLKRKTQEFNNSNPTCITVRGTS
jgi:hypothetical protein